MLSRVAENIFWMSRYMERTNIVIRTLKHQYLAFQDGLPNITAGETSPHYGISMGDESNIDTSLNAFLFNTNTDGSVINNIFRARENARSAQDNINKELWQCLNDMYHHIRDPELQNEMKYDPISVIDELIMRCMQYYGIINNSVSRSEGFYFLNMGKFVERGLQCIELLKLELSSVLESEERENPRWRYFLMSLNGYELYLSKHFGRLDTDLIVEQMLHADNYPNSLNYCWHEIAYYAEHLYGKSSSETARKLDFVIGKSSAHLKYTTPSSIIAEQIAFLNDIEQNFYDLIYVLNKYCFGVNVDIN